MNLCWGLPGRDRDVAWDRQCNAELWERHAKFRLAEKMALAAGDIEGAEEMAAQALGCERTARKITAGVEGWVGPEWPGY